MIEWMKITPDDDGFWPLVGPLCASQAVRRELGASPRVENGDVWLVGTDGGLAAACCCRVGRRGALLCHAYVMPSHRRKGLYRYMIEYLSGVCFGRGLHAIHAVASPEVVDTLDGLGFERRGMRGRYTLMMKGALHAIDP
jgi:GNAT superfamily N-acetyltransferase